MIAIAVFLAVLGAVFYFGRDVRSGGTGGTTLPAPATLTVDLVS